MKFYLVTIKESYYDEYGMFHTEYKDVYYAYDKAHLYRILELSNKQYVKKTIKEVK